MCCGSVHSDLRPEKSGKDILHARLVMASSAQPGFGAGNIIKIKSFAHGLRPVAEIRSFVSENGLNEKNSPCLMGVKSNSTEHFFRTLRRDDRKLEENVILEKYLLRSTNCSWLWLCMLHALAGMYRMTPPVVAQRAPRITCPRYGSPARDVELACSA